MDLFLLLFFFNIKKYLTPAYPLCNTYQHDSWSKAHPTNRVEYIRSVSDHFFNAITEAFYTKEPRNGNRLEEANPKQGYTTSGIEIHQLKDVNTALKSNKIFF
jgi:hypothetical protein